uniref:Decapping nuclease n=1 Tax=Panagrolaimus sp. JU765 TaxID=591449 RepID=A0AC34Q1C3_9BILA
MAAEPKMMASEEVNQGVLCSLDPSTVSEVKIQPVLLDDFILNRERKITVGRHKHKYLAEEYLRNDGRVQFDLNPGLDTFDPRPSDEGLDQILQYLLWRGQQSQEHDLKKVVNGADAVCWRGNVSKIAYSPYEDNGPGFKFLVDKFEDVLFLKELETETKATQMANQSDWEKTCTYWGFKFETFIFAEKGQKPTPDEPVSTWEEMGAAFLTTFEADPDAGEDKLKLFYIAEIDGLDSLGKHVEVKTQAYGLYSGNYFQQKAMRWWVQNTIVGIEDIIVGLRTKKGVIFKLEKVSLRDLNVRCNEWSGKVCLLAAQHFFNTLRKRFDELVQPGQILVLERKPNSRTIRYSVIPKVEILSPEFREYFGSQRRATVKRKAENDGLGTDAKK